MASSRFPTANLLQNLFTAAVVFNSFTVYVSSDLSTPHELEGGGGGRRGLMTFKEKASGTNITFDCSPSGPCVPCAYFEKQDEKYRCSETGYRIPIKCVKTEVGSDEENEKNEDRSALEKTDGKQKSRMLHDSEEPTTKIRHRNVLDDSSNTEERSEAYTAYRSCIPAINEEKLSVLGFEAIMLLLLVGSSFVIFKRKGTLVMPGAVRVPTNSRF